MRKASNHWESGLTPGHSSHDDQAAPSGSARKQTNQRDFAEFSCGVPLSAAWRANEWGRRLLARNGDGQASPAHLCCIQKRTLVRHKHLLLVNYPGGPSGPSTQKDSIAKSAVLKPLNLAQDQTGPWSFAFGCLLKPRSTLLRDSLPSGLSDHCKLHLGRHSLSP